MSARGRGLPKEGTLPSDPRWVVIDASDGDPRRWPANTTPNPDSEGNVNFMQLLSIDDGMAIKWRTHIGQALAEMLKYPDLESKRWVLKDWPVGYQFYDHNKGSLEGRVRHDLYLVGSDTVARFRSPPEFIPHAYWLMTDPTRDRSKCECKYCARKPQREISDAFGLSQRSGGSPSLAQYVNLPRSERNRNARRRALPAREGRVFATVRRAPKPVKLPKGPKHHMNPERERDLRALLGPKTLGERRWPREGELVWVKLDHPIPVNERDEESERITLWPGLIEEVHFRAEITPRQTKVTASGGSSSGGLQGGVSTGSGVEDTDPWTIVHKPVYKIKLIVSSRTILYGADHILPYQSCAPDDNLLAEVQSFVFNIENGADGIDEIVLPSDSRQGDQAEQTLFKRFQYFDPFPPTRPAFTRVDERRDYTETAVGAFTTAIQLASRLTIYWTPTDPWEYKMQIPLSPSMDVWSTSPGDISLAEQHALTQRLLGAPGANPAGHSTQTRFQGLWWGPERIWLGDLVRLKLARYQLAPEGTETIKKPSGVGNRGSSGSGAGGLWTSSLAMQNSTPGQDSVMSEVDSLLREGHLTVANDIDKHMNGDKSVGGNGLGAASRSLFLRVDGLFIAHVSSEDGLAVESECRMCGMLYELADDDWEASGDEFGESFSSAEVASSKTHEPSQTPTAERTIPTPLKSVMLNNVGPTVTDSVNSSVSHVSPPVPSSYSLFTANPELLSEPITDVTMLDVSNPDVALAPALPSATVSSPSLPAIAPSSANKTQVDSSVSKIEPSTPSNPALSGPLTAVDGIYPTPPPPSSLKFRPILRDGHEVVMPLTTLAGRYYPGLLSSSPLHTRIQQAMQNPNDRRSKAILALEGLVPGAYNSVDASRFLPRRRHMLREAENLAWKELLHYWRRQASQKDDVIMAANY